MTGFSIEEILSTKDGESGITRHRLDDDRLEEYHHVPLQKPDYSWRRRFAPCLPHSHHHQRPHSHHYPPYYYRHRYYGSQSPTSAAISPDSSTNSDDLDVDKLSRRPRTSITVCQREFLEAEFQKERYPTLVYIDKLSRKVHLQQYVIKVWFQNRRAKYRKEGHRRKSNKTPQVSRSDDKIETNNNTPSTTTSSELFTAHSIVDIEKTDYNPTPPHLKYNNKNTKFQHNLLMMENQKHMSLHSSAPLVTTTPTSYLWQPRSKIDVACRDSLYCHCLMCRENSKAIPY